MTSIISISASSLADAASRASFTSISTSPTFETQVLDRIGPYATLGWRVNEELVCAIGKLFIDYDMKERAAAAEAEKSFENVVRVGREIGWQDANSNQWKWQEAGGTVHQQPNGESEKILQTAIARQLELFTGHRWRSCTDMSAMAWAGVVYFSFWKARFRAFQSDSEPMLLPKTFFVHVVREIFTTTAMDKECKLKREQPRQRTTTLADTMQDVVPDSTRSSNTAAADISVNKTSGTNANSSSSSVSSGGSQTSTMRRPHWKKVCHGATVREVLAGITIDGHTKAEVTADVNAALQRLSTNAAPVQEGTVNKTVWQLKKYDYDRQTQRYMIKSSL